MKNYPRIYQRVYADLWAIKPEAFSAIDEALQRHVLGENVSGILAVDTSKEEKRPIAQANAQMGIGILEISGVIGKKLSSLETMCGGVDVDNVVAGARALAANPQVGTIIMSIDSPGGTVTDRKSTRLNSSHSQQSRMPSSA